MPADSLAERWLALWLRMSGVVCASALLAVVMPRSWHVAIHAWLGLGDFPEAPIAEYLARGMSAMCGCLGLILIALASDVRAYRRLIATIALALMGISLVATLVLAQAGMPAWWLYGDVGSVWIFGLVSLYLLRLATRPTTS